VPLEPIAHATAAAAPAVPAPLPAPLRWLLLTVALISLALGVVGIFLPVLPTVPFLLLAAWAAARSSPRLLAWLEGHPHFGRTLRDWRHGGRVRRRAKWTATVVMSASAVSLLWFVRIRWAAWLAIACMAVVLVWLWMRPEVAPAAPPDTP
jgi:uncharacterized membrane protein YbaN (DUF454 family)